MNCRFCRGLASSTMEFKTDIKFNIKTRIMCPKCRETFDKPTGDDTTMRCPHCGTPLNIARGAINDAVRGAEAKVARTLGSIGVPLPQQYAAMAKAKSLTQTLNIIGVLAGLWALFFPFPYAVAITICALIPVVSILSMAYLKGHINLETKRWKSEEPHLAFALAVPPAVLAWRTLNDFHIFAFDNVWSPAVVVSVLFSVMIWLFSADIKRKPLYLLVTLVFGFMYGYGVVIEANCLTDSSLPKAYIAKVLDKRTSYTSESHSYYIKTTPWGSRIAPEEISIRKSGFERIKVKDEITIYMKEGSIGIPWFFIRLKT